MTVQGQEPLGSIPRMRLRALRRLNVVVGLAHLAQAGLMLALSNDLALPVTAAFLPGDPVTARDVSTDVLFEVPVGAAVAIFLLLAAVDHLGVAVAGPNRWYEANLQRGVNYARWIEYSVSA